MGAKNTCGTQERFGSARQTKGSVKKNEESEWILHTVEDSELGADAEAMNTLLKSLPDLKPTPNPTPFSSSQTTVTTTTTLLPCLTDVVVGRCVMFGCFSA